MKERKKFSIISVSPPFIRRASNCFLLGSKQASPELRKPPPIRSFFYLLYCQYQIENDRSYLHPATLSLLQSGHDSAVIPSPTSASISVTLSSYPVQVYTLFHPFNLRWRGGDKQLIVLAALLDR